MIRSVLQSELPSQLPSHYQHGEIDLSEEIQLGFNKKIRIPIKRTGDTINRILFHIKMNSVPEGHSYKKGWYAHFFKSISLELYRDSIDAINTEYLQMKQLFNTDEQKLTFNYETAEKRIAKSSTPHEVIVEPFNLSELISSGLIRLIALQYQELHLNIETGSLQNILEGDPQVEDNDTYIKHCNMLVRNNFLGTDLRRTMALSSYTDIINEYIHVSHSVITSHNTHISLPKNNICSGLYIWVKTEDGQEIPKQLISNIKITINEESTVFSGLYCRKLNIKSNSSYNLYYVPYSSYNLHGVNGILFNNKVDRYSCTIEWIPDVDMNVTIHFIHKLSNIFITASGLLSRKYSKEVSATETSSEYSKNVATINNENCCTIM